MSVIPEAQPAAADGAHAHAHAPAPAASAVDHPNPGSSPSTNNAPAPSPELTTASSPENTSHASALPEEASSQRAAHSPAAEAPADASLSADPFLDSEPTPALPPRPDIAATHPAMATTAGAEEPAHPNANGNDAAREEQVSPQVQSLRAMFPDFDVAVLQSVLDSVNGDQDRALDILLGMSDPNYVSTQPTNQPEQTSVDLDEQLARQLMLEDQQQQQQQRHATGTSWPRRDQADVPYQARQAQGGQQRPPQEGGRTDLQELQRTMGQIAESGKRTFSSIVSKVKAKINEYEASRNTGQSSNSSTTPQWGSAPPTQLDRHTASQAYQQHYYGGEASPSPAVEQPITLNGPSTHEQVQGYDLDAPAAPAPAPAPAQRNLASPGSSPLPTPLAGAQISPAASPRPSGDVPRPPSTVSGSPVNAAKIGLLPKRPVSLLSANTPPATKPSDEDDELEYVENPFEEHK